MRLAAPAHVLVALLAVLCLMSCSSSPRSASSSVPPLTANALHKGTGSLPNHVVIAFDTQNGSLAYWRVKKGGGTKNSSR